MPQPFVILTGASGVGKTTIAQHIEAAHPEILVYQGDRMGLPSADIIASYGPTNEPGGPAQRAFAFYWIEKLARQLDVDGDRPILLETQCRIAFLREALAKSNVTHAQIILVECPDAVRDQRLISERNQPDLANDDMRNWSRFLHAEARQFDYEVLDTGSLSLAESTAHILSRLNPSLPA